MDYRWTSYREYIQEPILTDTEFCLSLFSPDKYKAVDLFIEYMEQKNTDTFPVFEDYIKLTDTEVLEKLYYMGINNISEFQRLYKNRRNSLIKELKMTKGIGKRQLSRITGIPKGIVERC